MADTTGCCLQGHTSWGVLVNRDLDHCRDTYSNMADHIRLKKETLVEKGAPALSYLSYNIMDLNSSCTTITRDQAKRIRKVLQLIPQRKQGK